MLNKTKLLGLLSAIALAAFLILSQTAASNEDQGSYRFGGAFLGSGPQTWTAIQVPLDPAGKTAAFRVNFLTYPAGFAAVAAALGGDTLSEAVGQAEMLSRDTFKGVAFGYLQKQGNPPLTCGIYVMKYTGVFTGPDTYDIDYSIDVFAASADANHDGFPDDGATPLVSASGTTSAKRVLP